MRGAGAQAFACSDASYASGLHGLPHDASIGVVDRRDRFGNLTRRLAARDPLARLAVPREQIERGNVVAELVLLRAESEATRVLGVGQADEREVGDHGAKGARVGDVDLHATAELARMLLER